MKFMTITLTKVPFEVLRIEFFIFFRKTIFSYLKLVADPLKERGGYSESNESTLDPDKVVARSRLVIGFPVNNANRFC